MLVRGGNGVAMIVLGFLRKSRKKENKLKYLIILYILVGLIGCSEQAVETETLPLSLKGSWLQVIENSNMPSHLSLRETEFNHYEGVMIDSFGNIVADITSLSTYTHPLLKLYLNNTTYPNIILMMRTADNTLEGAIDSDSPYRYER